MSQCTLLCRLNCEICPIEVHATPTGGVGTSGSHTSACRLVTALRWRDIPTDFARQTSSTVTCRGACTQMAAPTSARPGRGPRQHRRPVGPVKTVASPDPPDTSGSGGSAGRQGGYCPGGTSPERGRPRRPGPSLCQGPGDVSDTAAGVQSRRIGMADATATRSSRVSHTSGGYGGRWL